MSVQFSDRQGSTGGGGGLRRGRAAAASRLRAPAARGRARRLRRAGSPRGRKGPGEETKEANEVFCLENEWFLQFRKFLECALEIWQNSESVDMFLHFLRSVAKFRQKLNVKMPNIYGEKL